MKNDTKEVGGVKVHAIKSISSKLLHKSISLETFTNPVNFPWRQTVIEDDYTSIYIIDRGNPRPKECYYILTVKR